PILAPLAGSAVIAWIGWRAVFWAVALAALAGMALMVAALQETRGPDQRVQSSLGSAWRAYAHLLRDRHYLGLVAIGGFGMAGFFTYLANSSFVLIDHYGLTPVQYSLAFALNAVAFIGAAQLNGLLGRRFGLVPLVRFSATASALLLVALLVFFAAGGDSLAVLIVLYFAASAFMGQVIPTTAVLALEAHGEIAGTASALMGTLQMVGGAIAMVLVGLVTSSHPLPMVVGMAAGGLLSLAMTWGTLGRRRTAALAG
ncbi:MAG: MFS transporter, partial [Comamonadaceae bacterium]